MYVNIDQRFSCRMHTLYTLTRSLVSRFTSQKEQKYNAPAQGAIVLSNGQYTQVSRDVHQCLYEYIHTYIHCDKTGTTTAVTAGRNVKHLSNTVITK